MAQRDISDLTSKAGLNENDREKLQEAIEKKISQNPEEKIEQPRHATSNKKKRKTSTKKSTSRTLVYQNLKEKAKMLLKTVGQMEKKKISDLCRSYKQRRH